MSLKDLIESESPCKPGDTGAYTSGRPFSPLASFAALTGGGPVLVTTARFGRSAVRDAAYRFRDRHPELDLKLSWRLFANLKEWGKPWPAEQGGFAGTLILSAAGDPVVERAVGRCLADLAWLGRPLLWGVIGQRVRWQPRFSLAPNGWPPELVLPYPATYARLGVAYGMPDFCPLFDPILYSAEPDYSVSGSGLQWWEERHFHWGTLDGKRTLFIGCRPDG
jgi:hypothetical protein